MPKNENLSYLREKKVSSKGNTYESLTIIVNVNGKNYELGNLFIDDSKACMLDLAGIGYAEIK